VWRSGLGIVIACEIEFCESDGKYREEGDYRKDTFRQEYR